MEYSKGVIGYALYMEQRNGNTTQQILFTPPFYDHESGAVVEPAILSRVRSAESPQRPWMTLVTTMPGLEPDVTNGQLRQADTIQEAAEMVSGNGSTLDFLGRYMKNAIKQGWKFVGDPIILEVTERDGADIRMARNPEGLLRRLERDESTRLESNYPSSIYEN